MPNDSAFAKNGQPTLHQGMALALVDLITISAKLRGFYGIAFSWRKVCVVLFLLEQKSISVHAYKYSI